MQTKVKEQKQKIQHCFPYVNGHNFRTVDMTPPKFRLNLCFVVMDFLTFPKITFLFDKVIVLFQI